MTAPSHVVTGLAVVVAVGRVGGVTPDAVGLLCFLVGSLAPDIDGNGVIARPGSILRRLFGREVATVLDAVFEFFAKLVNLLFGHRGFVHSPLLALIIIWGGGLLGSEWLMWFGGGYAAHLLGDSMTAGGIPMLSPFSSQRMRLSRMRTGSWKEHAFTAVLSVVTVLCGWSLLPGGVKDTHRVILETLVG